jgi:hypothetical protein
MAIDKVVVHLREVPYEQCPEAQRRAWDSFWRELMRRTDQSYRPQPEAKGGSIVQRRYRDAVSEAPNDTATESPMSTTERIAP